MAPGSLIELSRAECLELAAVNEFGRLAVTTGRGQLPIIRPVNYRFDDRSQSIVFRTGRGSKFHALMQSRRACFEIDSFDPGSGTAWSVIIAGMTEQVTQASEISRLDALSLQSWAPGDRPHWIRIRARTVSGRRIVVSDAPNSDNR